MQEVIAGQEHGPRLSQAEWGSDLVVECLRSLDIPYISLNPGASYRGIHDSLVNFQGGGPEMIVCTHEETAVAVASGYARVTGKPMAVALHDVVGLQHATMAIYGAWCGRLPMIIIGGTGPLATENRRPGTDWNHTALVQANQIRDYTKWDDQPASVGSIPEAIMRAYKIATTEPMGPVYLCFDTDVQEAPVTAPIVLPDPKRYEAPAPTAADPTALREAATLLANAQWPVIVAGSVSRHPDALPPLEALAQLLAAPIIAPDNFVVSEEHPLNLSRARQDTLRDADVVLALDVSDLFGAFSQVGGIKDRGVFPQYIKPDTKVIHISIWDLYQKAWATDYQRLYPVDVPIAADTSNALPALLDETRALLSRDSGSGRRIEQRRTAVAKLRAASVERLQANARRNWDQKPISMTRLNAELGAALEGKPWMMRSGRPGWPITEAAQVAGSAGANDGGGLGLGIAVATGQALAHKGDGRFFVHLGGDGDFLFTPSVLWTLNRLNLPMLIVINDNRIYGNDEGHQEHMARIRGRPVENKKIGIAIDDPPNDLAAVARAFNIEAIGPVTEPDELRGVLDKAISMVMERGCPVVVDVITTNSRGSGIA